MTNNEIIKALECCCDATKHLCVERCSLYDYDGDCCGVLKQEALALINRQQAEIERLNGELITEKTRRENAVKAYHEVKVEAIKAFVEMLKAEFYNLPKVEWDGRVFYTISEGEIDNIAKGWMVEDA